MSLHLLFAWAWLVPGLVIDPPRLKQLELAFVGDVVFARYGPGGLIELVDDSERPFDRVSELLRADLLIGNLETPAVRTVPDRSPLLRGLRFGASPSHLSMLADAGFWGVTIANNHIVDLGTAGLEQTASLLRSAGIAAIGEPVQRFPRAAAVSVSHIGWRVAVIGVATWLNAAPPAQGPFPPVMRVRALPRELKPVIEAARFDHDVVVIAVHWGREFEDAPGYQQRKAAHGLIDAGASLVIGHHPHVLQGIERYRDGLIAYSLGNFLFPSMSDRRTSDTGVLHATFSGPEACLCDARFHPVELVGQRRPRPAPAAGKSRRRVVATIQRLSRRLGSQWTPTADGLELSGLSCRSPQ